MQVKKNIETVMLNGVVLHYHIPISTEIMRFRILLKILLCGESLMFQKSGAHQIMKNLTAPNLIFKLSLEDTIKQNPVRIHFNPKLSIKIDPKRLHYKWQLVSLIPVACGLVLIFLFLDAEILFCNLDMLTYI